MILSWGDGFLRISPPKPCFAPILSPNACLQRQALPLDSVAVTSTMTKAITSKTTGFGGAVSGVREV